MLKIVVPMAASILATEALAQTEIVGNVESKCIIVS